MKYRFYIVFFILSLLFCTKVNAQEYNLIIKANAEIPKDILKSYQNFRGDSVRIYNKCKEAIQLLQNDGYITASIDSIYFDSTTVIAGLYRGAKFYWGNLDFSGLEPALKEQLGLSAKELEPVSIKELQKAKNSILSYYENSGYPFAKVLMANFEIRDSLIGLFVEVQKGQYYKIDSIIVKGGSKISENYLYRCLEIKPNMPFNQKRINEIEKKIRELSFLAEIKPAEVQFKQEGVDLYLYLENKKANMFSGIIGFLPDNSNTGDLLVTGELNLNLVNSFGKGEEISLNWEKLESSTQKLDVEFMYPYLLKSNLGIDADFSLYKKDSTYLSLATGLGVRLFLTNDNYVKLYYRYKNSSRIGDNDMITNSVNFADIKSNVFGASYYLSELDYKFNPRKGVEFDVFAGAGFKSISGIKDINDSLGLNTGNKTIEVEAGMELDVYYPVYKNFVFHFSNTTRYLDQFAEQNKDAVLFENELYRFGGTKSLRGFDENIFYASVYSIQNVEIRYLFEQNSAFYLFWNGAYYYKNVTHAVTEDFPWGFGIGMDFQTKAGIFSLSYALGKQFDNPIEIRAAKIHFGYISRF